MTQVALFDVVIPVVIAWVLIDDLLRSISTSSRLKPVAAKIAETRAVFSEVSDKVVSIRQAALRSESRLEKRLERHLEKHIDNLRREDRKEPCFSCGD